CCPATVPAWAAPTPCITRPVPAASRTACSAGSPRRCSRPSCSAAVVARHAADAPGRGALAVRLLRADRLGGSRRCLLARVTGAGGTIGAPTVLGARLAVAVERLLGPIGA